MTGNVHEFITWVGSLHAGGGGDIPEDQLDALAYASSFPFRPEAQGILILITDAPNHHAGDGSAHTQHDQAFWDHHPEQERRRYRSDRRSGRGDAQEKRADPLRGRAAALHRSRLRRRSCARLTAAPTTSSPKKDASTNWCARSAIRSRPSIRSLIARRSRSKTALERQVEINVNYGGQIRDGAHRLPGSRRRRRSYQRARRRSVPAGGINAARNRA